MHLTSGSQVLSGTTPFPNESDEEIVDKITRGLRPEWSSANPSQKLANALWEHIEACWNQEPKERPTAFEVLQTLLALGEDKYQVPVASVENAEDDPMVREWEQAEDTPDSMFCLSRDGLRSHIWLAYSFSDTQRL